jgi:hypothetical protein
MRTSACSPQLAPAGTCSYEFRSISGHELHEQTQTASIFGEHRSVRQLAIGASAKRLPSQTDSHRCHQRPRSLLDSACRLYAEPLSVYLRQPVIIENKPGAGGLLAVLHVAKSPADGYTLLGAAHGDDASLPSLHRRLFNEGFHGGGRDGALALAARRRQRVALQVYCRYRSGGQEESRQGQLRQRRGGYHFPPAG